MARINTKGPLSNTTSDEAAVFLDGLSKACLIDLYTQALALALGSFDEAPTLQEIADDARPMLSLRNDREPAWVKNNASE
jgi:hypothetical protein